jgi:hypothetical protein
VAPTGSSVIALNDETPTIDMWLAYATCGFPVIRNTNHGMVYRDPANKPARRRAGHQVGRH